MRRERRKEVKPGDPVTRSIHRLMPPSKHDGSERQRSEFVGPKCPYGHTVDISTAKWTTPTGTYNTYCRFPLEMAENPRIPR